MKHLIMLFMALLICTVSFAQPDSLWSRTYGGTGTEYSYSVVQVDDSGYVLCAQNNPGGGGNWDAWLIRTNAQGDTLWSRTFGGPQWECGYKVGRTAEGGYFIAGSTESYGAGSRDYWLVNTDADGSQLWSWTYGGAGEEQLFGGTQTADSGFILAGYTYSFGAGGRDFWLVKTDAYGYILWDRTFGGPLHEGATAGVVQTTDGGYMVAGIVRSFGEPNGDFWLIKTDASGDSLWSRTYGTPRADYPYCVRQTLDGGYIVTGFTTQTNGITDAWLLKTDANGESLWSVIYGTPDAPDVGLSVVQTSDGGFVVAGGAQWNGGPAAGDAWMFRTDGEGTLLWSRTFGGPGYDMAYELQRTADGGYVLAGCTNAFGAGSYDAWLIKTGPDPMSADDHPVFLPSSFNLSSYPNPFNPSTMIAYDLPKAGHVSLRVVDLLGREIAVLTDGMMEAGTHRVMFDGSNLASGIYLVKMDAGKFTQTRKLMLLK